MSTREIAELVQMLTTLESVRVCRVLEDKWVSEKESSGLFTVKSLFKSLIDKPSYYYFYLFFIFYKKQLVQQLAYSKSQLVQS